MGLHPALQAPHNPAAAALHWKAGNSMGQSRAEPAPHHTAAALLNPALGPGQAALLLHEMAVTLLAPEAPHTPALGALLVSQQHPSLSISPCLALVKAQLEHP